MRSEKRNMKMILDSTIEALQVAFNEYKKCQIKELMVNYINEEGQITVLSGYEERHQKTEEAFEEVLRLKKMLREIKEEMHDEDR